MKPLPDLDFEQTLILRGFSSVIGCDEVGRGSLAGPVTTCLVHWTPAISDWPSDLRDSKLVPEKRRQSLAEELRQIFPKFAFGSNSAKNIDKYGIQKSLALAVLDGLSSLSSQGVDMTNAVVLLDGTHDFVTPYLSQNLPIITRSKADERCVSVAAASVMAKAQRDTEMKEHHLLHPQYGFASNKGYGSPAHRQAIEKYGLTELHRVTWIR